MKEQPPEVDTDRNDIVCSLVQVFVEENSGENITQGH